jgi:hypothetical protein
MPRLASAGTDGPHVPVLYKGVRMRLTLAHNTLRYCRAHGNTMPHNRGNNIYGQVLAV